jgi:5'(3')-deoxyribonucleotidase
MLQACGAIEGTIDYAKSLIIKEKEQITDAHTNAYLIGEDDISVEDANEASIKYYNQTYNRKIPELLYKDGTPMRKVKLGKEAQELLDEATKRFNQPNL